MVEALLLLAAVGLKVVVACWLWMGLLLLRRLVWTCCCV